MRKLTLSLLLALTGMGSAFSADQLAKGPSRGGDWQPALQRAIDDCAASNGGTVTAPSFSASENERHWDSPLVIQPPSGQAQCRVSFILPGNWRYNGTGAAVRTFGLKRSILRIEIRLSNPGSTGIWIDGDALRQSSNRVTLDHCFVVTDASKCVGYRVGSPTSNDVCDIVLRESDFASEVWGSGPLSSQLSRVHAAGNRGFQFAGYNTVRCSVRDCSVSGCDVAVATSEAGKPSGAAGLTVDGFDGSYNCLGVLNDGAFGLSLANARLELGGRLLCQGTAGVSGRGYGGVTLTNVNVDGFDTSLGFWGDPYSLVSWNANGSLSMQNVYGYGDNWKADRIVAVRSNLAPGPYLTLTGCFTKDVTRPGQPVTTFVAGRIQPLEGAIAAEAK